MDKTLTVRVGGRDTKITIRRLLKKEFRPLALTLAERIDSFIKLLDGGIVKPLPEFLCDSLDYVCHELIVPFAGISAEMLEEMEVADIISLLKELLEHNGIVTQKLIDFFGTAAGEGRSMEDTQTLRFGGTAVPSPR